MLDRIHKISEIIAAVAIIASLVFVGLQLGQNTRAIQSQEDSANWLPWVDLSNMVVGSADFADIFTRAQRDGLAALSPAEATRFDNYMIAVFTVEEQNYRAWQRNPDIFSKGYMESSVGAYVLPNPGRPNEGSRAWWQGIRQYYGKDFVAWVDSLTPLPVEEAAPTAP